MNVRIVHRDQRVRCLVRVTPGPVINGGQCTVFIVEKLIKDYRLEVKEEGIIEMMLHEKRKTFPFFCFSCLINQTIINCFYVSVSLSAQL